jgi:hypothetical protein
VPPRRLFREGGPWAASWRTGKGPMERLQGPWVNPAGLSMWHEPCKNAQIELTDPPTSRIIGRSDG